MNKKHNELVINELSESTKSSMRTRILTGIIFAVIAIPCLVLGGWFLFGIVFLVLAVAIYEFIHATGKKYSWFVYLVTYIVTFSLVYWIFIKTNLSNYSVFLHGGSQTFELSFSNGLTSIALSTIGVAVSAGIYFGISVLDENFTISDACYFLTISIVIALGFQAVLFLRYYPEEAFGSDVLFGNTYVNQDIFHYLISMFLLVYVLFGTMFNDIGAYFVGLLFGRHKINERISPKKTWAGFWGGIFISFVISALFAFIVAALGYPILPNFDLAHWYWIILVSIIMPIVGNLGGFAFSAIKRNFGIKDFGKILPGHGGVLDRFDSLLFVALAVSILLTFIAHGWNFLI